MASIADILAKKYPGTIWTSTDRDYSQLIWYPENTVPKPTEEEIFQYEEEVDLELRWDKIRNTRNKLLTGCDWTQLPDSPLSETDKQAWATFRQQLRDVTTTSEVPENVIWPVAPGV